MSDSLQIFGKSYTGVTGIVATDSSGTDITYVNCESDFIHSLSRPNLLKNWYFVGGGSQLGAGYFPINSNGQTSYSIPASRTNCIDRWYGYDGQGSGTIQIVSGGVTLTKSTNADGIYFGQSGVYEDLTGKTVTLSILTSAGALFSGTATVPQSNIISAYPNFAAGVTIESGKVVVQFYSYASTVTVVAAKLELGNTQTLAHQENGAWVLNEVPNYELELAKCRGLESGTISKIRTSGTFVQTSCYKIDNVVVVAARHHSMTSETASGSFFTLPVGFRPRTTTGCFGYIEIDGDMKAVLAQIFDTGIVEISYSANKTTSQVGFSATFPV